MKILIDENIPKMTAEVLRALGHEVHDIRATELEGSDDTILWEMARREERLLVTTDMGFAQHREENHHGILIIRLKQPNRQKIHDRVLKAVSQVKEWSNLLVVMQDHLKRTWKANRKI